MTLREQLCGMWLLRRVQVTRANGDDFRDYRWGTDPKGILVHDATGWMCVQIMRTDRPAFGGESYWDGQPEEIRNAFLGYAAYFGSWRVASGGRQVTYSLTGCLYPNAVGTEEIRIAHVENDVLELEPPAVAYKGEMLTLRWHWIRASSAPPMPTVHGSSDTTATTITHTRHAPEQSRCP